MEDFKYAIAGLPEVPGYRALCDYMQAQTDNLADKLADADTPAEAMKLLRTWQVMRKVVGVLKTAPQDMQAAIDSEKNRNSLERYSNLLPELTEEELESMFRRGPVPPPGVLVKQPPVK